MKYHLYNRTRISSIIVLLTLSNYIDLDLVKSVRNKFMICLIQTPDQIIMHIHIHVTMHWSGTTLTLRKYGCLN